VGAEQEAVHELTTHNPCLNLTEKPAIAGICEMKSVGNITSIHSNRDDGAADLPSALAQDKDGYQNGSIKRFTATELMALGPGCTARRCGVPESPCLGPS
jgi:hypothetical protein